MTPKIEAARNNEAKAWGLRRDMGQTLRDYRMRQNIQRRLFLCGRDRRKAMTLSEIHPEAHQFFKEHGYWGYAAMMERYASPALMSSDLGLTDRAVNKNFRNKMLPLMKNEKRARALIEDSRSKPSMERSQININFPEPKTQDDSVTLLVEVPAAKAEKVQRVLGILGAQCVDI